MVVDLVIVVVMLKVCCSRTNNPDLVACHSSEDEVANLLVEELMFDTLASALATLSGSSRATTFHVNDSHVVGSWEYLEQSFV